MRRRGRMTKTPEELAEDWIIKEVSPHTAERLAKKAFLAGWKAGYGKGFHQGTNTNWESIMSQVYKQIGYDDENT